MIENRHHTKFVVQDLYIITLSVVPDLPARPGIRNTPLPSLHGLTGESRKYLKLLDFGFRQYDKDFYFWIFSKVATYSV
jgi:hypothetical protein